MKRFFSTILSLALPFSAFSLDLWHGSVPVQLGVFTTSQGKAQNINVQGIVGNSYTVNNQNRFSGLFGIGYYIDGLERDHFKLSYGVNGFYLAKTPVSGVINQELTDTNLAYHYDIQHIPIYLAAKGLIKTNSEKYNITLDGGLGPNIMRASHYYETPLTSYTIPDNAFAANNNVAFTATVGAGLRLNNVFGKAPLECGYRFFYLGQGQLQKNNNLLINSIGTGNAYANAIMCSITV